MIWRLIRVIWTLFLLILPLVFVAGLVFQAINRPTIVPAWLHPDRPEAAWLVGGMFLGAALALSMRATGALMEWDWSPPKVLIGLILCSASLGAALHQISGLGAGMASALAILAVITGYAAYDALRRGDSLGIQSSWGGLGGGLGGWQLSRSAGLVLVTLAAVAGAVMSLR